MVISTSSPAPDRAITCCPSPASRPVCKQQQCLRPEAAQPCGHLTWLRLEAAETQSQEAPAQPGLLHLGQPRVSPHYYPSSTRLAGCTPSQKASRGCAHRAALPGLPGRLRHRERYFKFVWLQVLIKQLALTYEINAQHYRKLFFVSLLTHSNQIASSISVFRIS